ncbi:hypothetical protein ACIBEH_32455 [Nocardia salmonicida]|uniref:hypothetical protein n=1 Tax=Nocardia salmonicida TaxID=53431 RepID=UPI0037904B8A
MTGNTNITRLIEQSSLGTKQAKKLRHSVPAATGKAIVRAAAARTNDKRKSK